MSTSKVNFILLVCIVALCVLSPLAAYQFSPLEQQFDPTGSGSTKTYTIVNDSDNAIAIMVSALIRDQDKNGNEVNRPADGYFYIAPSKTIVKPQSSQLVRVQYRGSRTVTNELSFRIKAEQIPYNKGRQSVDQGMFNFLYNYVTSAYVAPSKVIERVDVAGVKALVNGEGESILAIAVSNRGNVHQILMNASLTVEDNKGNSVLLDTSDQLGRLMGLNLLAKKTVVVQIPFPYGLAKGSDVSYKATLKYSR